MNFRHITTLCILLVNGFGCFSQADSLLLKEYPLRIGNLGFAMDSLELVIGDVGRGGTVIQELGLYNFGKEPIQFSNSKSGPFVSVTYRSSVLQPGQTTLAMLNFEVLKDLPLGPAYIEVTIESSDKDSPSKFFYLLANVVEDSTQFIGYQKLDTVPRLVFDHCNFDFGQLHRGKKVQHTFLFSNMGDKDLLIHEVETSNGCNVLQYPEQLIPPGGSGSITIKVHTKGAVGIQHRSVSIYSNDPITPVIILGLHGMVRMMPDQVKNPGFCAE